VKLIFKAMYKNVKYNAKNAKCYKVRKAAHSIFQFDSYGKLMLKIMLEFMLRGRNIHPPVAYCKYPRKKKLK
jgi:hypothetical protein